MATVQSFITMLPVLRAMKPIDLTPWKASFWSTSGFSF